MTHYFVVSPEMHEVVDIGLDDGTGPTEYFCCVVSVDAPGKGSALKIAVKHADMQPWVEEARGDGKNPFAGLMVSEAVCPHGVCMCDLCGPQECEACYTEAEAASAALAASGGTGGG